MIRPFQDNRDPQPNEATLLELRSELAYIKLLFASLRLHLALKQGFNPDQPRDDHGRWTDSGSASALFDALLQDFEGDTVAEDVAYPGDFHDAVRAYFVKGLRAGGNKVETEVSLVLPGTPLITARIDILARDPKGTLYGTDIKTGVDPTFTPSQQVVHPHAIGGAGGVSPDGKIRNLGLTPGVPLPAFAISVVYARGPSSPLEVIPLPAEPR
ncbi:MAG: hypothetical protein JNM89_06605 [Hyphomicrobiaceae bacterium]|nr:hypothetical protein [Hyphomicrobiaceae bacterium]